MAVDRLSQVAVHDKLQITLADVERAMAKLEDGSYGMCDVCGRPIGEGGSRRSPGRCSASTTPPAAERARDPRSPAGLGSARDRVPSDLLARPAVPRGGPRRATHVTKSPLAPRFQEAIDEAAMRLGDTGSDDYLAGWRRGDWTTARGQPHRGRRPGRRRPRGEWPPARLTDLPRLPRPRRTCVNRLTALLGDRRRPVLLDGGMGTLLQDNGLDDGGVRRAVERRPSRGDPRPATRRTPPPGRASSPRTPSAAPVRGCRCTVSRTGSTSSTGPRAAIAREVADEHGILVAGDLGPTGELLAPLGTMDVGRGPGDLRRAAARPARRRHRRGADRDDERPRRGRGRGGGRPRPSYPTCR